MILNETRLLAIFVSSESSFLSSFPTKNEAVSLVLAQLDPSHSV